MKKVKIILKNMAISEQILFKSSKGKEKGKFLISTYF